MMSGGTKGMTVLMVDDDEDFAMLLWGILDEGGYRVVTATDSNKAWECLRDLRPDLITLDIMMANKTGMRLYREVRNDDKLCTIPIVVITGSMSAGEEFRELIEADQLPPPNGYLGKPVDRNALAATLHCLLGS